MASPRPVPRTLGGKVRQEELFLVAGRDSAARIGDQQLQPSPADVTRVTTISRLTIASRIASAALSTRFTTTRLNWSGSRFTRGRSDARSARTSIPSRRPSKTSSPLRTTELKSQGTICAFGKRENWENSSASVLTDSTSREIVAAHSRSTRWGFGCGRSPIELARDPFRPRARSE